MPIQRIASLLVGVCFVGGSISTFIYAPWDRIGEHSVAVNLVLLMTFAVGMLMTCNGIWPDKGD